MSGTPRDPGGVASFGLDASGLEAALAGRTPDTLGGSNAAMPGAGDPQVPTGEPQTRVPEPDAGQAGQPPAEGEAGDASRTYTEDEFQAHKRELQKELQTNFNTERTELETQLTTLGNHLRTAVAGRMAYQEAVKKWVTENGGDERDLALFDAAMRDAEGNASRQAEGHSQSLERWLTDQDNKHSAYVRSMSINPKTGTQIFDPNDADIAGAYEAFKETARRAAMRGSLNGEAADVVIRRAHMALTRLIQSKRDDALMSSGGQPIEAESPQDGSPAGNRQRNMARGTQNLFEGGGAASMTEVQLDQMAEERYPGDRKMQAQFKSSFRRQNLMHRIG